MCEFRAFACDFLKLRGIYRVIPTQTGGRKVKKLLIMLAAVGLIQFASIVYYESKMLKKPIMLVSEVNYDSHQINLSYITNFMKPSEVQSIEIAGVHYSPHDDNGFMFNHSPVPVQEQSYVKYAYYAIFSPTVWLQGEEESYKHLESATEATVYFTDGYSEKVALTKRKTTHNDFLGFRMNSAGTRGSDVTYEVLKPFTLNSVTAVENKVDITSFKINNNKVPLPLAQPLEIKENDTIYLATANGVGVYAEDWFLIEMAGVDSSNNEISLTYLNYLNSPASEEWVKQIVKERGEK